MVEAKSRNFDPIVQPKIEDGCPRFARHSSEAPWILGPEIRYLAVDSLELTSIWDFKKIFAVAGVAFVLIAFNRMMSN